MLEATRSLVQGCKATWKKWPPPLQDALIHCIGGENATINPLVIENRLHDLDKDSDRLLTMDGSENVDLRIKQISDEMLQLKQMKKTCRTGCPAKYGLRKQSQGNHGTHLRRKPRSYGVFRLPGISGD